MLFPTRRLFAIRHPWLLLVVPALLSLTFAASAVAPEAQDAITPPPNCMQDLSGKKLQCTANDVRVRQFTLVEGPGECQIGEPIRVRLQAQLESGANERYDIGLFVAQDGGDALTGACFQDYLPPPLAAQGLYDPGTLFVPPAAGDPAIYTGGGPFLTVEDVADQCGDIEQGVPTFRDVGESASAAEPGPIWIDAVCQDRANAAGELVPDQVADIGACVSWDNLKNDKDACETMAGALPGTVSKCNCSFVQIAGLTVAQGAQLEIVKVLDPASDPRTFDLLIDGAVASGPDGAGNGGGTGPVAVSAGTSANPGADHTVAEALHWSTATDVTLDDYEITYACVRNDEPAPFVVGDGPGPLTVRLMPGDHVVCTWTNKAISEPPDDEIEPFCVDGYVIDHREQPVDGTAFELDGQPFPLLVTATSEDGASVAVPVDEHGYFVFAALDAAKAYSFSLDLPPGWQGIVPLTLLTDGTEDPATGFTRFEPSESCYRIVFKIRRLVRVPVVKWEERLDGRVIRGDDWLITATPVGDPFAKVVTATVEDGQALLVLTPGTWTISESVKPGWTPVTPSSVTRVVDPYAPDDTIRPVVFKNRQPPCTSQITVTKYGFGHNPDGALQPLGPLAGWHFTVSRADMTAAPRAGVTEGDGRVVFAGLLPGVYRITETVQPGWAAQSANPVTVVLKGCEAVEVEFENVERIGELSIHGRKLFQAWEKPYQGTLVGLAGWEITATLVGTGTEISAVTDGLGNYSFDQDTLVAAGMGFPGASIAVCEEDRAGWNAVTPPCVTVTFPYPLPATYTGAVVDFVNVQDPPLPGVAPAR